MSVRRLGYYYRGKGTEGTNAVGQRPAVGQATTVSQQAGRPETHSRFKDHGGRAGAGVRPTAESDPTAFGHCSCASKEAAAPPHV